MTTGGTFIRADSAAPSLSLLTELAWGKRFNGLAFRERLFFLTKVEDESTRNAEVVLARVAEL